MERCSFFNAELVSGSYDRTYLAEDFARYFATFIGNGVFASPATQLQVTAAGTDMKVTVKPGKAWANGYFYENTANLDFILDNADGVLNRIDTVVVQLDLVNRTMAVKVKKGTFATNPEASIITRDADTYELQLASIYVAAGAVSIAQANITDTRTDSGKCGMVTGVVDQISTSNLFAQFTDAFNTWFETVQGILGQDEAANLLNLITAHTADKANPHEVTALQVGAAPTSHTHTKSEVTDFAHAHNMADVSGIVPVAQGGTGQITLAAARNAMGLGNTTGALPVANGGTGATSLASITVGNATKWNNYTIWQGTQAAYDAIISKSSTTIYFIVG